MSTGQLRRQRAEIVDRAVFGTHAGVLRGDSRAIEDHTIRIGQAIGPEAGREIRLAQVDDPAEVGGGRSTRRLGPCRRQRRRKDRRQ
ncbi:hypothetical protein D9M71_792430 [compost metagenome]